MDKKAQLTIIGAAIILLTVVTITYGFFVSGVDNTNPQTATITTGTMELTFADNDTGVAKQMIFGESIEKKFTLENTGTVDATAYLYWKDLVNTYLYGSLVYKLEYSETANGAKTVVMNNAYVPRSSTPTEEILSQILTVPADTTYYYTLTITLVNSETVDQTADLRATFTTGFNIKVEGSNKSAETLAALGLTNQVLEEPTEYNMFDYTYNGYQTNFVGDRLEMVAWDYPKTVTKKDGVNTSGIYAMEDDFGTSYYFRGPKTLNNIVKFGKYNSDMYYYTTLHEDINYNLYIHKFGTLEECQSEELLNGEYNVCDANNKFANAGDDMYWRIVRINGDGSLRLMYIGTGINATGNYKYIGKTVFNGDYEFEKIGYTYNNSAPNLGDGASSIIKQHLENWYSKTMINYDSYIASSQYFNDVTGFVQDGILINVDNNWTYGAWAPTFRLARAIGVTPHATPTLKTSITNETHGGVYYLKIGLISADELVLSGTDGVFAETGTAGFGSEENYPYTNDVTWTMSPAVYDGDPLIYNGTSPDYVYIEEDNISPVINLTAETAQSLIGNGSSEFPYRLEE